MKIRFFVCPAIAPFQRLMTIKFNFILPSVSTDGMPEIQEAGLYPHLFS
jgi:hypothetical protein